MKSLFLSLFILIMGSACLSAQTEESPPLAPLLPLTEEFPLGLNQANRNVLMEKIQQREKTRDLIQGELERRSFPWLTIAILLVCGGGGWFLYLLRDQLIERNTETLSERSPLDQFREALEAIEKRPYSMENCSEYYNQLSTLILLGIKVRSGWNTLSMTTIEIAQKMQRQTLFSPSQAKELILILIKIDEVKFNGGRPTEEQTIKIREKVLQAVDPFKQ